MKNKFIWLVLSCLMVLSLVLVSCGTKTTPTTSVTTATTSKTTTTLATTTTTKATTTSTQAAQIPQYGGSLVYRNTRDISEFDPFYTGSGSYWSGTRLWYETVVMPDLTTDPKVFDFTGTYHPFDYDTGRLAERWETADTKTWTLHIRQGVKWQDLPPLNGREFTASDVEYFYHRQLGLGSGFTKASTYIGWDNYKLITSVKATDKYTVVFTLSQPDLETMRFLFEGCYDGIMSREAVEKWGDVRTWQRQIGTGPFILKDYVSASSWTAVKNPNYWGYDKLYPKNQLPYLDEIKVLIIPDNATAYAALRTGKIDMVESVTWQQSAALLKTNPSLKSIAWPQNGWSILMHVDTKPFDDIRVRKAMQMSLDLLTIAKVYYGGTVSSTIYGAYALSGYYTPFEQWPQDVKDGFTYNPDGAKKLLAEAGFPNGFKFTLYASSVHDLDFYQVLKSYLADVGIDMQINAMENTAWLAYTQGDKADTMSYQLTTNVNYPPMVWINQYHTGHYTWRGRISDPAYDKMWNEVKLLTAVEQQKQMIIKMSDYATAQYWRISTQPFNYFAIWQPWLKGYNGALTRDGVLGTPTRTMWIDQNLKKSMGY